MRTMICGAALIALAACGEPPPEPVAENVANTAEPALATGPMLGEVDLSRPVTAEGANWTLELAPGTIFYTAPGTPQDKQGQLYFVAPRVSEGSAIYRTQNLDGEASTLTLTAEPCGDGQQPLTAELVIGERSFTGCAAQVPEEPDDADPEPADGNAANAGDPAP